MRSLLFALVTFAVSSGANLAYGWGCEGHQMVALLARVHLTPAATNAVDQLLRANPVETNSQFCKGGGDLMADVASWADMVRNAEKTGLWHYIDIPLAAHVTDPNHDLSQWCDPVTPSADATAPVKDRPGCVVTAIGYLSGILSDASKPSADRAAALRYLIHFVGDMHQPLHTTDNNDRGGNCTSFKFFADERPSNLHSIWDSRIISKKLSETAMTPAQYATQLDSQFGGAWKTWAAGTVTDWAWDGHTVAEKVTYGALTPSVPVETPDPKTPGLSTDEGCNAERGKVTALHISIGDDYYAKAMPVIDQQLAKGGYRLAGVLNSILTR